MTIATTEATLNALADAVAARAYPMTFSGALAMTPHLEAAIGRIMAADAKAHRETVDRHFGNTGRWMTDNRHGAGRPRDTSDDRCAKVRRAVEMRNGGATFAEIGAALGVTDVTARNMVTAPEYNSPASPRARRRGSYDPATFSDFAEATISRILAETGASRPDVMASGRAVPPASIARDAITIELLQAGASNAQIGAAMNRSDKAVKGLVYRALISREASK